MPGGQVERCVAHVAGLFAEDSAQQFFLRSELGFTLGSDLAHQNIPGLDVSADADDAAFVQVLQQGFRNVRDVAGDFFRTELGVARLDFELLDVDRGVGILFDQLLADQDGVFKVVAAPGHEGHEHVAPQGQFAMVGAGAVGEDLPRQDALVLMEPPASG